MKHATRVGRRAAGVEVLSKHEMVVLWKACLGCLAIVGAVGAAYLREVGVVIVLLLAPLALGLFWSRAELRGLDWAVLIVGVYEGVSLALSTYSANSVWYAEIAGIAVLTYLVVRLAIGTAWQSLVVAGLVGAGGAYLGWTAITEFGSHVSELRDAGLTGIVAFRARLITPESYVLGEWLTILLLTLPFTVALPLWLWAKGRKRSSIVTASVALVTVAGLCLSCSRAVFWSVVLFFLLVSTLVRIYRLVTWKVALGIAAVGFSVVSLVLAAENAAYPGIAEAYVGSHSSQIRSTEGRIAIWKRSLDLFRQHPVWGVGAGNSPLYLNSSGDQDETVGFASRTFSLPFQLLTEKGIVGLLLYGAVFSLTAWEMHRRRDLIACCLFAGLLAVLARELTYSSLLEHPVTAMLTATILGLICRSAG